MPTILLVEDEPAMLEVMTRTLKGAGHEIVGAKCARSAQAFVEGSDAFALALIDFWLNGKDCVPLLDLIQEKRPEMPVVLVTGGNNRVPIETSHAIAQISGIKSILQKPFSGDELLALAQKIAGNENSRSQDTQLSPQSSKRRLGDKP